MRSRKSLPGKSLSPLTLGNNTVNIQYMRNHTKTVAPVKTHSDRIEHIRTIVVRFTDALPKDELDSLRFRLMDEAGISTNQYITYLEQK